MQVIPHITNEIKDAHPARGEGRRRRDVVISRDRRHRRRHRVAPVPRGDPPVPRARSAPENVLYLHVTLVPFIDAGRRAEDEADAALGQRAAPHRYPSRHRRLPLARRAAPTDIRDKIALFADVEPSAVDRRRRTFRTCYLVPEVLQEPGARLGWSARSSALDRRPKPISASGSTSPSGCSERDEVVEIALVGKYVKLQRRIPLGARSAEARGRRTTAAQRARALGRRREHVPTKRPTAMLEQVDGVLVPGGFGSRGWEGKILACRVAREREIPYLGICLGMHVAVSEFARHVRRARRRELDRDGSRDAVPGDRPAARSRRRSRTSAARCGSVRRRSSWQTERARARRTASRSSTSGTGTATRSTTITARARRTAGLVISGTFQEGRLVEIVELPDHPWFVASQFHPGVQVAADASGAALPRLRRRRTRALAWSDRPSARPPPSAATPDRAVASEVVDLFTELAALPSPPGDERAVADVVVALPARPRLIGGRGRRGPKVGSNIGNVLLPSWRRRTAATPSSSAHISTPFRLRADRAGDRGRRRRATRRHDPRRQTTSRPSRRCSKALAGCIAENRPSRRHRASVHAEGGSGLARRGRVRP